MELNKIINALEHCSMSDSSAHCRGCPYRRIGAPCVGILMTDAAEMLKMMPEIIDEAARAREAVSGL